MARRLTRRPDWEQRLHEFVATAFGKPYAWGKHDCVLFCFNEIRAVTGRDFGRGVRGKYSTRLTAAKHLDKLGHATLEAFFDALLPEKPIGFAQRGDIVLADDGIPAVCVGEFALSTAEDVDGLHRVPPAQWVKAWAVG